MNKSFMQKVLITILIVVLFVIASCKSEEQPIDLKNPFVGGTVGINVDFQNLRKEIFDGGRDPFEIVVKLENKGEADVPKNKVSVKLSGFNPAVLGRVEEQLVRTPSDDLLSTKKDIQGNVLASPPVPVEFDGLNYLSSIVGATSEIKLLASVCYGYKTVGVSKLCVRSNILSPSAGGLCEINENKMLFSSSAPVQLVNFVESAYGKDKVGFNFDVKSVGQGNVYSIDSGCVAGVRAQENKVFVKINTQMSGLSCTGLKSTSNGVEGFISLFDGSQTISCKQQINTKTDFEQVVNIEATYDYEDTKQETIPVKISGETVTSS